MVDKNCQTYKLLKKDVLSEKVLHDFTTLSNLTTVNEGSIEVSNEVTKENKNTLKVTYPTSNNCFRIRMTVNEENWEDYNRISFWVYPVKNGFDYSHMCVEFMNDGVKKCPTDFIIRSLHYATMQPNKWNEVVYEFPEIPKDKVTGFQFNFLATGTQANMKKNSVAYLSDFRLQKVNAEKYAGWDVDNNKIALCHSGYATESFKCATTNLLTEKNFSVVNYNTGETVYKGDVSVVNNQKGNFSNLEFTNFKKPGKYILKCGKLQSYPFEIKNNRWNTLLDKLQNFFYEERCGCEVPGIHLKCHEDSFTVHPDGRKISVSGGWHDAGDLSQGLCNTAEAVCAFLQMAEKLKDVDCERYEKYINEAKHGLSWVLKTSFRDGYRSQWATMTEYTLGIVGDSDDIFNKATNFPHENLCASMAECLGFLSFNSTDPDFANHCLEMAKEDYFFAINELNSKDGDIHHVPAPKSQLFGEATYAAALLYKATQNEEFLNYAVMYSQKVMECQQAEWTNWDTKFIGFFYTDETHQKPLNYDHRAHDQALVMGIALLLELAPNHKMSKKWKNCLVLYKEYIKLLYKFSKPYGNLPSGIYFETANGLTLSGGAGKIDEKNYKEQLENGIMLNKGVYLRQMPVVIKYRGNFGVMLSKAKAVTVTAKALNDNELFKIATQQIEYILGNNPFCKSFMYGEGYDYPEMFCDVCRNIVGALPVGLSSIENEDAPYMPIKNCATYLEIWVHPVSRMIWTISDLY